MGRVNSRDTSLKCAAQSGPHQLLQKPSSGQVLSRTRLQATGDLRTGSAWTVESLNDALGFFVKAMDGLIAGFEESNKGAWLPHRPHACMQETSGSGQSRSRSSVCMLVGTDGVSTGPSSWRVRSRGKCSLSCHCSRSHKPLKPHCDMIASILKCKTSARSDGQAPAS